VDVFGGLKSENIFGIQASTGASASFKKWYGAEFHRNHASFRQRCTGNARIDSDGQLLLVGGAGDISKLILDSGSATFLHSGKKITLGKSPEIEIDNGAGAIITMTNGHIVLKGSQLNVQCDAVHFGSKTVLQGGKDGGLFP
jgi:hypothetical protein